MPLLVYTKPGQSIRLYPPLLQKKKQKTTRQFSPGLQSKRMSLETIGGINFLQLRSLLKPIGVKPIKPEAIRRRIAKQRQHLLEVYVYADLLPPLALLGAGLVIRWIFRGFISHEKQPL